ncbi:hypothetical protein [Massilibacterium senegalense]|uniref:hypothetical protein n=1 Tax=Massilibacterium senegalense TaxID=1632858 RepID=UPI0007845AD3|nr:hypothetical protein [Massilibacterium senegalense]
MNEKWTVQIDHEKRVDMNISNYCVVYDVHNTKEESILSAIFEYFQPRSKVKDTVSIYDQLNAGEKLSTKAYQAFLISNQDVIEEQKLGSKSLVKNHIKRKLLNNIESEGYLATINSLVEDLLKLTSFDLPLKSKKFTHDLFIKLIEIDFLELSHLKDIDYKKNIHQLECLLPVIFQETHTLSHGQSILIYRFPEAYLSAKEQMILKKVLDKFAEKIKIIVHTESKYFLADSVFANNYFFNNQQKITQEFIGNLEWNAPLDYSRMELENSFKQILFRYIDKLEVCPVISNYKLADIMLFEPIDIYTCTSFLKYCGYKFQLDLDRNKLNESVHVYVQKLYENI